MLELRGETIRLRQFRDADIPLVAEAVRASAKATSVWFEVLHENYSIEDARVWVSARAEKWAAGLEYTFAILDLNEDNLLGVVDLNRIERSHNFCNLGYWVRTDRTRGGVATEAVKLIARFDFEELKFSRIEIVVAVGNAASQRVAEKAGAQREGVLRNRLMIRKRPHHALMNSLIPNDFGIEIDA